MPSVMLLEPRGEYAAGAHFRESDLSALWAEQRFPKAALVTLTGEAVRVVYRGRAGAGPGPDYRDAIVSFPGGLAAGDVELHVRADDFYRHGHGRDPAYDGVVLHVVLFAGGDRETRLAGGGTAPIVALGELLLHPPRHQRRAFSEPCRDSIPRLGGDSVARTLDRLGRMRFRQKAAGYAKRLAAGETPEGAFWSGLLDGLGYGGERDALRVLAAVIPWSRLRAELIPLPAKQRVLAAERLLARSLPASGAPASGVRPRNRAEQRIKGAAVLAARFTGAGITAALADLDSDDPLKALLGRFTVPGLIGRSRAIELIANVVLPLAAGLCGDPAALRYEALFAALPLPAKYGAVRHLHAATSQVPLSAAHQQGMLYLLRQYCTQGGCGRCPLS